jgi:hypothetical protein
MKKKKELQLMIEHKRKQLHVCVCKFGILSKEVLNCSEELDILINIHQKLED